MVCSTSTAEAASTTKDGGVRQEDSRRVIVAGNSLRCHLDEVGGDRIPYLRLELGSSVRERLTVDLTAGNKNVAIWQDHSIGEDTLEPHRVDGLDRDWNGRGIDADDVGIRSSIDALVACCTANRKNSASSGIVHDRVTAHGIAVVATRPCRRCTASTRRPIPVHSSARTCLENGARLPAEEPAMVVSAIDALLIGGKHRSDWCAIEEGPCICEWAVDFTIFGDGGST